MPRQSCCWQNYSNESWNRWLSGYVIRLKYCAKDIYLSQQMRLYFWLICCRLSVSKTSQKLISGFGWNLVADGRGPKVQLIRFPWCLSLGSLPLDNYNFLDMTIMPCSCINGEGSAFWDTKHNFIYMLRYLLISKPDNTNHIWKTIVFLMLWCQELTEFEFQSK